MSTHPELATATRDLVETVTALDETARTIDAPDIDALLHIRAELLDGQRNLKDTIDYLTSFIGEAMGRYQITVEGVGVVKRHPRRSIRNGDNEALVNRVLDSRLADKTTGDIADETPYDKVRHVWNLSVSAARPGALKARGIEVDEFADVEVRGWTLEIR